jgi:hypothetical protein
MECNICDEKTASRVICPKCSGACCVNCFQRYLLTTDIVPNCMHCRLNLSDDFIYNNTSFGWMQSVYELHRANLLFAREKARLHEDQECAERYIKAKKQVVKIDATLGSASAGPYRHKLMNTRHYNVQIIRNFGKLNGVVKKRKVLVKACVTAGCKGMLDEQYCCGLCDCKVCVRCHEILAPNHHCNPGSIESVAALKREAKACPSCAALISKIDGCDQMWCTQCHVAFSWATGLRETGITHNPHFYEWARKNGGLSRAAGDVPNNFCNSYPTLAQLIAANAADSIIEYHRQMIHLKATLIDKIPLLAPDNFILRVRYLANEITAAKFKELIVCYDGVFRKNLSGRFIYDMIYQASGDLFRNLICTKGDLGEDFVKLFAYGNECLRMLDDRYGCVFTKV